jgi:curved DNA-binding protein CbpA
LSEKASKENDMNLYEQIDVSVDADEATIRQALAMQRAKWGKRLTAAVTAEARNEADKKMRTLVDVRDVLLDPQRRNEYDRSLAAILALPSSGAKVQNDDGSEVPRTLCSICGESISVRALKCRFCGAQVQGKKQALLYSVGVIGGIVGACMTFILVAPGQKLNSHASNSGSTSSLGAKPMVIQAAASTDHKDTSAAVETFEARKRRSEALRLEGMRLYQDGERYFQRTGDLAARDDHFWQALAKFRAASSLNRSNPEPLFNMAVVLEAMNDREAALPLFREVVEKANGPEWTHIWAKSASSIKRIENRLSDGNRH